MGKPVILLIKEIYYPILAAIGVPANLVTILILCRGKCGLSHCIALIMLAMATSDLLVMIINVMMYHIFSYNFTLSFLQRTPVCQFILYLTAVTLDMSVWFTVFFTFDRFAVICCQKFQAKYCTKRTAAVVITMFSVLIFFKDLPFIFGSEHQQIINQVQWGCQSSVTFLSSPLGIVFFWFHIASLVWLPFTLIALFNSLTIRRITVSSRDRKKLRSHTIENKSDPEIENRRKSIILLFTVSGSFLLLWLPSVIGVIISRLVSTNSYQGDRTNLRYIAAEVGTMLKFMSSCPNTCIYAATQRKFREELKGLLKSPFTLILLFINKEGVTTLCSR
ncbi:probable G-protein coupled receptor 139 [Scyliorhinus canicula]|uniref:probable G-protein coupled receptor 139 n=1 Tax=Scyliorhinus canicula TaxID=7830 RepID=UPI0018F477F1|nr:probable G-protein coupled receptor 139 [Scyliorhinus canicula]